MAPRARLWLLTVGLCLVAVGLSWGKAVASIGMVVMVMAGLPLIHQWRFWKQLLTTPFWAAGAALWLWGALSGLWSENLNHWREELVIKLPWVLMPIAVLGRPLLTRPQWIATGLTLVIAALGQAIYAGIPLLTETQATLSLLQQGKSVQPHGSLNPIYLGLILYAGSIVSAVLAIRTRGYARLLLAACMVLQVLFLHVLALRTALLATYATLGVGVVYLITRPAYRRIGLLVGLASVVVIPMLIIWVPSLNVRIKRGWDDIRNYNQGGDLNNWSMGRRLAEAEATWYVFTEHPLTGVGLGDLEQERDKAYDPLQIKVAPERRVPSHNQYLNLLASLGLMGGLLLLMVLVGLAWLPTQVGRHWLLLISAGWAAAMLTEAMLERQTGLMLILWVAVWLYLAPAHEAHVRVHTYEKHRRP